MGSSSIVSEASVTLAVSALPLLVPAASQSPTRNTAVFLQDTCLEHRFIRSRDTSQIVERPERIRAVKLGLASAIARLENLVPGDDFHKLGAGNAQPDDLADALSRMNIGNKNRNELTVHESLPIQLVRSSASVDILNNAAVKFVHGDIDGDVYLENLVTWGNDSEAKVSKGGSEIPEGLSQGDLYLCPGSVNAMQGAIGTVCQAVDTVIRSTRQTLSVEDNTTVSEDPGDILASRAFVTIRPPGHHCGEDTPSGFCFVNNVTIAAAHAHLQHGINRVVILDIDLHHGNGTQSLVWQINEETYRQTLESEYSPAESKPGLRVYYGSLHDILSYPCEDGKLPLVQAASVSIHGQHGQHIENVHLQPYHSHQHFWDVLYTGPYSRLLKKAGDFIDSTGGPGEDVLVFISCGFDACEHEYPSMSRHQRKVPTSFYHRFAQDASAFADKYAQGRLISVLEGGYSDRALTSGAMAHLCGLTDLRGIQGAAEEEWWDVNNLVKLEQATRKGRRGRPSLSESPEPWLERTLTVFSALNEGCQYSPPSSAHSSIVTPSTMTLRERKKNQNYNELASGSDSVDHTPLSSPPKRKGGGRKSKVHEPAQVADINSDEREVIIASATDGSMSSKSETDVAGPRKLPRVILHVKPPSNASGL